MSINTISNASSNQTSQTAQSGAAGHAVNAQQTAKNQLNATLVESLNISISISGGNGNGQSQTLLFRAAIDRINQILGDAYGSPAADASQPGGASGPVSGYLQQNQDVDTSPETTAKRILDGATGFFAAYANQHPELSPEQQATNFVSLVRGGFEQGYASAVNILKSLNVFNGNVSSDAQKTYDLVQKGFDDFLQGKLGGNAATTSDGSVATAGGNN